MHPQLHTYLSSSDTLFLSLPQPSLPSALSCNPTNSLDTSANVQNWIVKQVRPIRYVAAIETSQRTSDVPIVFHTAWNDSSAHQLLPDETPVMLPNQTKINKPVMRCEVCKIDCNNEGVFEKHISGKKHKRNMQLLNNPSTSNTISSGTSHVSSQIRASSVPELESKKRKLLNGGVAVDSVRVCTICDIACNSEESFSKHLTGKKHAAQVRLTSNDGIAPKKIKVAQPARCEICMIDCNSKIVYEAHLSGKKHLMNLLKLSKSKNDGAGATAAGATVATLLENAMQHATNPGIDSQEKPDTGKQEGFDSHNPGNAVMLESPEKDFATKDRKCKLDDGGAATISVRLCSLCNVVCNSETAFKSHLAGQKDAAMLKTHAEATSG